MQNKEKCHENVWILSGTSEGPALANKLLGLNYVVFVSVVTYRASKSYVDNPKLHIITGRLNNTSEIIKFIEKNKIKHVIDATHPFALIISSRLNKACKKIKKPLIVFARNSGTKSSKNINYISGLKNIEGVNLKNKNILLAIGSKLLDETAIYYLGCGANVFTRVIPTQESITKAFGSCIKNSNIAILEPSKNMDFIYEKKLCEYWEIDYVICRDSGSYAQKNWEEIIYETNMKLFLVKRPKLKYEDAYLFFDYHDLINYMKKSTGKHE